MKDKESVLITGINGFTGVHLERYLLSKGFDVYGTVIDTPLKETHLQCDLTRITEVENVLSRLKPDYIIHIAAISFPGEKNASLIYDVNVIGTEHLFMTLKHFDIHPKKIIVASSATVYGRQKEGVLHEKMCPRPVNHYGCSKLSMEHMVANYFDTQHVLITRPFNYTGVGQEKHFLIPKIVAHFREGKKRIELGNLDVAREFNAINYVVDCYHQLLLCDAESLVVNLSSNRPVKLLDVLEMMSEIAGYTIEVEVNPLFVRENEIPSLSGSTELLESLIEPGDKDTLRQTLRTMYESDE